MPRPRKNKEVEENKIDEIINKMKDIYPSQSELIDKIVDNVQKSNNKNNNYIVTDKKDNYYLDDFNGVWNENFELVGAYENNKIYLYGEIKKITNRILQKK